jgi:hypothetical protein
MTFVDVFYFCDNLLLKYQYFVGYIRRVYDHNFPTVSIFQILGRETIFHIHCVGSTVVYFTAKFHSPISTGSIEVVLKLKRTESIITVAILSFCKNKKANNKVAHLSEFYYHT